MPGDLILSLFYQPVLLAVSPPCVLMSDFPGAVFVSPQVHFFPARCIQSTVLFPGSLHYNSAFSPALSLISLQGLYYAGSARLVVVQGDVAVCHVLPFGWIVAVLLRLVMLHPAVVRTVLCIGFTALKVSPTKPACDFVFHSYFVLVLFIYGILYVFKRPDCTGSRI